MPDTNPPTRSVETSQVVDQAATCRGGSRWVKPIVLLSLLTLVVFLVFQYGHVLSLDNLAEKESGLQRFQSDHPYLVYGAAWLVYVVVTGLSLPGATALTLVYGWYFGFFRAVVLVSFASTAGATVAFLTSRYLLGDSVQAKFGDKLRSFNERLEKEGAFYLFTLRLIPAVPFFVINLVMGLTPLKTRTYWWVSQLGMLPGTLVYVYAGSRVPNLSVLADKGVGAVFTAAQLLQLGFAFALLGLFPLIIKYAIDRITPSQDSVSPS